MKLNTVSKATLGRLPLYLQYLKRINSENISSAIIARELYLGEVQVRKDLNQVSGVGKPKIGYKTLDLIKSIEKCLGKEKVSNAILVGAGKLGRALLDYKGFEEFGVNIIAAFDHNPNKVNENDRIFSIDLLEQYIKENNIQIGIIAVPSQNAQEICDILVNNNIKAIWNFAPVKLYIPNDIVFVQENLALSLAYLNNQLIGRKEKDETR